MRSGSAAAAAGPRRTSCSASKHTDGTTTQPDGGLVQGLVDASAAEQKVACMTRAVARVMCVDVVGGGGRPRARCVALASASDAPLSHTEALGGSVA